MSINQIAYISTFPPTQCGIATYTADLISSFHRLYNNWIPLKVNIIFNDNKNREIFCNNINMRYSNLDDYENAIRQINNDNVKLVNLQHEFKIFGGDYGEYILFIIDKLRKPLITTFHTVYPELPENKRNLFLKIANRSDLIYVFSQNAMNILHDNYLFSNDKIKIIPHGVPIVDFCLPKNTEFRKKINEKIVFISAGHLRESKGIVFALKALKEFKEMHSDFKYYIVGANHPRNSTSISYRIYLEQLIIDLDLKNNVELINEHLPLEILIKYIQMSDIALVPYSNKNQSSSGILSLFMACGRPIISTKFQYATSILKPENGILVNFDDTIEFLHAIDYLAENELIRSQMMNANYEEAKKYHWDIVSLHYYSGMTNIVKNNFRYD